jgi:hypothetical protein
MSVAACIYTKYLMYTIYIFSIKNKNVIYQICVYCNTTGVLLFSFLAIYYHKFRINEKALISPIKADFQSSHEAPRSSLRVMHEHFHPITMLNS